MNQDEGRSCRHSGWAFWMAVALMQGLSGCDTSPLRSPESSAAVAPDAPRTERAYIRKLQLMVGQSIETLFIVWGVADAHWINESGSHVYQYLRNDGETVQNEQPIPASCATRFVVFDGVVRAYSYDGNSCKASDAQSHSDYVGPTARLWAGSRVENAQTIQWFGIVEVIGAAMMPMPCLANDWRPNAPRNFTCRGDEVPTRPMKVRIRGERRSYSPDVSAARISAGTLLSSVEGTVDFSPMRDHIYHVTGELTADGFTVWIEDEFTRRPATRIVAQIAK